MKTFKRFYTKHRRGFTLVELMTVVVILGVLAMITIPTYNKLIRKSRVADGLNVLEMLASAEDKYYVQNGLYTSKFSELNSPLKNNWQSNPQVPETEFLETRNFKYAAGVDQSATCIFAESLDRKMKYTLVKNYKTKAKVGCVGDDCEKIKDYVGSGNLSVDPNNMCPSGQQACPMTQEECLAQEGFIWVSPCTCMPKPTTCKEGEEQIESWIGTECSKSAKTCKVKARVKVCKSGNWVTTEECRDKKDYCLAQGYSGIDEKTCQCINNCENGDTKIHWLINQSCDNVEGADKERCGLWAEIEKCQNGQYVPFDKVCKNKLDYCIEQGYIGIDKTTCECVGLGNVGCTPSQNTDWTNTGRACSNPVSSGNPDMGTGSYGKGASGSNNLRGSVASTGSTPGTGGDIQHKCGVVWEKKTCNTATSTLEKEEECRPKECPTGTLLNNLTCECVTHIPCDENNQLACQNVSGISYCDPCPSAPSISSLVAAYATTTPSSGDCYHCGSRSGGASTLECDYTTGQWRCVVNESVPCNEVSGTINPNIGALCDGGYTPGNQCGRRALSDIQCIRDPDMPANLAPFMLNPVYDGECTLKEGNECFDGQTNSEGKTCQNCKWETCTDANQLQPGQVDAHGDKNFRACQKNNGVPDENYCGTERTTKQKCESGKWVWDYTDAECEAYPKPETQYQDCSNSCLHKERIYECVPTYTGSLYYGWTATGYGECELKPGTQCVDDAGLSNGLHCFDCKIKRCPESTSNYNVVYNKYHKKCYRANYRASAIIYSVANITHPGQQYPSMGDAGEATSFRDCGTDGNTLVQCHKECNYGVGDIVGTYNFTGSGEYEMYCESNRASTQKVIDFDQTYIPQLQAVWCGNSVRWNDGSISDIEVTWCTQVQPVNP